MYLNSMGQLFISLTIYDDELFAKIEEYKYFKKFIFNEGFKIDKEELII